MKKKILILYNKLFHYRIPIFNLLSEEYDLTVAYSITSPKEESLSCNFKIIFLPVKTYWKFVIHKDCIHQLCQKFDLVIAYGQLSWINYSFLALQKKRNYKLLFWSIGVPASYSRKFDDENYIYYKIRDYFRKKSDGLIFYSDYPIEKHLKRGFDRKKLFVANNTVSIKKIELSNEQKDSLLFIGTLYFEKGLEVLLNSYYESFLENNNIPTLKIIGGGNEFDKINNWISAHKLNTKIMLLGPIYDNNIKSEYFRRSLACISPNQAGLSVLESMGYGVPFITVKDAITGGEIFNIKNNISGKTLNNINELKETLIDITNFPEKYIKMGENAYKHYWESRKPQDMADGLINAIETILKNN